ncbi:MAG: FIVAR domain-containing protein [Clostridia bacterium]|nr:FIVAR domain-containing protein [Clostridia bacterium]
MTKKVLSVVLALILVFSIGSIAASAATSTADLQALVDQLPTRYNAHFYNDATEATILKALDAAEAAIASGSQSDIDAAYALCEEAFDVAYTWKTIINPYTEEDQDVIVNRDESKAIADVYYSTNVAGDELQPGDEFQVTYSIKTNFYIQVMSTGFVYDRTKFEYVPDSIKTSDAAKGKFVLHPLFPYDRWEYGYGFDGVDKPDQIDFRRYPETWDVSKFDQYAFFEATYGVDPHTSQFTMPEEKMDLYTITLRVKDDAKVGETGKIYGDNEVCGTKENWLIGMYEYPVVSFHRAYGPNLFDTVAELDGVQKETWAVVDLDSYCGQTINFNGNMEFKIVPKGEVDYTALKAAIAEKETLDAYDYTPESWAAYEEAVKAGEEKGLVARSQETVDSYTQAITDARNALKPYEQDSEIISIKALEIPEMNTDVDLEVLVSMPVTKLRFVDSKGSTLTYSSTSDLVTDIINNEDGTQTWLLKCPLRKIVEYYDVYVKDGQVWSDKVYKYRLADGYCTEGTLFSYKIADNTEKGGFDTDNMINYGAHDIIVEAGNGVTKIQLVFNGATTTFSSTNAQIERMGDYSVWTINYKFAKKGEGLVYDFNARTAKTSFEKSELSAVVDVLV